MSAAPVEVHGATVRLWAPTRSHRNYRLTWRDAAGVTHERSGSTDLDEARRRAAELAAELARGTPPSAAERRAATVEQALAAYLDPKRTAAWSRRYYLAVASQARNHIMPGFGANTLVRALTPDSFRVLLGELQRAGYAAHTISQVARICYAWTRWLEEEGYLASGTRPMRGIARSVSAFARQAGQASRPLGAAELSPDRVLSAAQVLALAAELAATRTAWWGLACLVAAQTGVRWGELLALRPEDVDLGARTIRVHVAWGELDGGRLVLGPPKSRRERLVVIPAELVEPLRERIAALSGRPPEEQYLFCTERGCVPRRGNWGHRVLRPAMDRAGWPAELTWHSLRHYFCTWALAPRPAGLGLSVVTVARLAGHSDASFTLRTYVGVVGGAVAEALAATA